MRTTGVGLLAFALRRVLHGVRGEVLRRTGDVLTYPVGAFAAGDSTGKASISTVVQNNFQIDTRQNGTAIVIAVSGELDLASSPALREELARADESGAQLVVLDLRQLVFMDSTGLSVVVRAHQNAEESGRGFAVVRGGKQVERLLTLTGVAERLTVVDQPEELLDPGTAR
jgi:anti-anti-sigma factor